MAPPAGANGASSAYWYRGRRFEEGGNPRQPTNVDLSATIVSNGRQIGVLNRWAQASGSLDVCEQMTANSQRIGDLHSYVPGTGSRDAVVNFLQTLSLRASPTSVRLRSPDTEQKIAQRITAEQQQVAQAEAAQRRVAAERTAAERTAAERSAEQVGRAPTSPSTGSASAVGGASNSRTGVGQVVAAPAGATAPYVLDDRGGYWKRLPDGRYQEITQQEYNAARDETNAARAQQAAQAQAEAARQAQAEAARQAEAEAVRQAQADATAEAIVATAVAAAPLVEALGNGIANVVKSMEEQYQGMTVGVLYHPAFTPGDNGLLGISLGISMPSEGVFTGVERLFFDDFLGNAYVDLGYGLGGSDVPDEAPVIAMGIGVNLRRLAVPIGGGVPLLSGLWMPQAGYRWVGQYESNLHQPVVGITRLGQKTIMRVNATRYNGEPHIGASIGYVF